MELLNRWVAVPSRKGGGRPRRTLWHGGTAEMLDTAMADMRALGFPV